MSSWFCVMMSSCCSPLKTHNVSLFCVYHCHIRNKLCVTCLLFVEAFDVETGPTWTFLHVLQRKKKHQKESSWIHHFCWPTNIFTRPGKNTKNYWKLPFIGWIFPLKMVIFHRYVKLPEGNIKKISSSKVTWSDSKALWIILFLDIWLCHSVSQKYHGYHDWGVYTIDQPIAAISRARAVLGVPTKATWLSCCYLTW